MTSHPVPRKISFTGSVETGKKVALSAAPDLKRVTLELGGNDPAIVLDDADPAAVASAIFAGAFNNNGQVCSAIKRVYVPEALYDDVVEGLAAHARAIKVGEGTEEGVKLGPINNEPQYERVKELVADALVPRRDRGHRRQGHGPPRLLLRAHHPHRPLRRDADRRRGAVRPGAAGRAPTATWATPSTGPTPPTSACRARCGAPTPTAPPTWPRSSSAGRRGSTRTSRWRPQQPFGGFKWSGIGVENGPWGLAEFSEFQVVHRSKSPTG